MARLGVVHASNQAGFCSGPTYLHFTMPGSGFQDGRIICSRPAATIHCSEVSDQRAPSLPSSERARLASAESNRHPRLVHLLAAFPGAEPDRVPRIHPTRDNAEVGVGRRVAEWAVVAEDGGRGRQRTLIARPPASMPLWRFGWESEFLTEASSRDSAAALSPLEFVSCLPVPATAQHRTSRACSDPAAPPCIRPRHEMMLQPAQVVLVLTEAPTQARVPICTPDAMPSSPRPLAPPGTASGGGRGHPP